MNDRVVIDPITRIEGHLRIEARTDADQIAEAWSSGTMVRGIEIVLKDRDPRDAWAFAQRICGVCTLVHGIASVRAVEDALDYAIPDNARLIRNLMIATQFAHDHVMHFYHLHALDWVNLPRALNADPQAAADAAAKLSNYPRSSPGYFREVQQRLKRMLQNGRSAVFGKAYWDHPGYALSPEVELIAVAHYLDALAWQRDIVKLHTIFGGRNPHPHFLVGGAPNPINLDEGTVFNASSLAQVSDLVERIQQFVEQVYLPDVLAIASGYTDWFARGEGVGNFLCYGEFPMAGGEDPPKRIPAGVILDRDLSQLHPVDLEDEKQVQEFVSRSWYRYEGGPEVGLHPYDGETELAYTGPEPPYEYLNVGDAYSWLKAPRWRGRTMEVGPLARVLTLYASGDDEARDLVDKSLSQLGQPVEALFSTMGRTAARALESKLISGAMSGWVDQLRANIAADEVDTFNPRFWQPETWPRSAAGVGVMEAPRGALAHWVRIEDERIANYQAVVPSTWNASPRDPAGLPGPYEAALQDGAHRLHDPDQPLEVLRTIHSFDPCLACAVHMVDPDGTERTQVQIR